MVQVSRCDTEQQGRRGLSFVTADEAPKLWLVLVVGVDVASVLTLNSLSKDEAKYMHLVIVASQLDNG